MIENRETMEQAVLALLYLNYKTSGHTWKTFDWDIMNSLHEKGLIGDPVNKKKSVFFTEDGLKQAEKNFEELFSNEQPKN